MGVVLSAVGISDFINQKVDVRTAGGHVFVGELVADNGFAVVRDVDGQKHYIYKLHIVSITPVADDSGVRAEQNEAPVADPDQWVLPFDQPTIDSTTVITGDGWVPIGDEHPCLT